MLLRTRDANGSISYEVQCEKCLNIIDDRVFFDEDERELCRDCYCDEADSEDVGKYLNELLSYRTAFSTPPDPDDVRADRR